MTMTDELYAIGAGYNVAEVDLDLLSGINPGDGDTYDPPKGLPLFDDGQVEPRLDGHISTQGYSAVTWFFTRMSYLQYSYFKSTYCNGTLSGEVTILTTLGSSSFVRKNAIVTLKKPKDNRSEYRYQDVEFTFTKLADPS